MIAIYTGAFRPWHKGHMNIYMQLCRMFGNDNVHVVIDRTSIEDDIDIDRLYRLQWCLNACVPYGNVHVNRGLSIETVNKFDEYYESPPVIDLMVII